MTETLAFGGSGRVTAAFLLCNTGRTGPKPSQHIFTGADRPLDADCLADLAALLGQMHVAFRRKPRARANSHLLVAMMDDVANLWYVFFAVQTTSNEQYTKSSSFYITKYIGSITAQSVK